MKIKRIGEFTATWEHYSSVNGEPLLSTYDTNSRFKEVDEAIRKAEQLAYEQGRADMKKEIAEL